VLGTTVLVEHRSFFLGACETNLPNIRPVDELLGLARAFHSAGSPTAIASNWPVEVPSTIDLTKTFYDLWLTRRYNAAKALLEARRVVKKNYESGKYGNNELPLDGAYFWGGFTLNGWPLIRHEKIILKHP